MTPTDLILIALAAFGAIAGLWLIGARLRAWWEHYRASRPRKVRPAPTPATPTPRKPLLDRLHGNRTFIAGILIVGAITIKIVTLPPDNFVVVVPHLFGLLTGFGLMLGSSKAGGAAKILAANYRPSVDVNAPGADIYGPNVNTPSYPRSYPERSYPEPFPANPTTDLNGPIYDARRGETA